MNNPIRFTNTITIIIFFEGILQEMELFSFFVRFLDRACILLRLLIIVIPIGMFQFSALSPMLLNFSLVLLFDLLSVTTVSPTIRYISLHYPGLGIRLRTQI